MRALKLFVFSLLSIGLIDNAYALSISYSPSPFQIQQGVSYTNLPFLTTYGASGPVTFSSSSMPSGLILNPDGTISGLGAQLDYTFLNGSNGYTQNSFRLMLRKPF